MLEKLHLYQFSSNSTHFQSEFSGFYLKTCQRQIYLTNEENQDLKQKSLFHCQAQEAYTYLLEILCGLKSKLVGENEIVAQFKDAYHKYKEIQKLSANSINISPILEKLLQDTKNIRTLHLKGICHKTYASIVKKILLKAGMEQQVLVLGSGAMAEDVIGQLRKHTNVTICARNEQRVHWFESQWAVEVLPWSQKMDALNWSFVVNTIGDQSTDNHPMSFLLDWYHHQKLNNNKLLIDLSSPSIFNEQSNDFVKTLDHIFAEGAIKEEDKNKKIQIALVAINDLSEKRKQWFERKSQEQIRFKQKLSYAHAQSFF